MKTDLSIHSYCFAAALALLTAIFQPLSSEAANLTWSTTNGSWTTNANWSPQQQPGSGYGVIFTGSSSNYTSTLGANYTIFRLTANGNAGTGNLTIAPGGNYILTLSAFDSDGSPSAIQINASVGAVSIQSALKLDPNDADDNIISVENAAGLTLTQFATGTDGFIKEGNGTLYLNLSSNNTIARYTAIERGTVELAAGNLLQDWNMGVADSAGSNGTLNIQSGSMEVDGSFEVGYEGSGMVNVNGGNLTLANQVDIGRGNGTAVVNLNSGSLRQTAGSTSMTIGGGSGSGELNMAGGEFATAGFFSIEENGTLSVSGGNATIGNPTNVNGGFQASGGNTVINLTGGTIASGRVVLSNGAAFNLGNGTTAGSAQILNIYTSQNDNGTLNLNHNSEISLDSNISNGIAINQIGSGTTMLTGGIDVTKNATISSGTLAFGGNSSSISIPSITNNSALVFASSSAGVFAGKISGTGSVTQNGTGMTFLGGNNTYTGQTLVQNGALSISSPQALYNGTASDWIPAKIKVESGATLAFGIGSNSSFSTNSVESLLTALASNATSTGGFQAGSFFGFNTQDAYGSALTPGNTVLEFGIADSSRGALGVSKIGNGMLTLNASNTYTGDTRVTGGSLSLGNGGSLASGNLSVTGSGSILALDYANAGVTFANISVADGGQIQSSSGSVNFTNSAIVSSGTIAAPVGGTGSFRKTGNGTAVISDTLTHTGGTTIENGTLQIGAGSTSGTISGNVAILQNGTLGFNRSDSITASNAFSGNGAISKVGNNTLTLTGNSADFEGATTISAGTLQIGNGGSTGSLGGNITASTGATLAYNSSGEAALDGLSGNGTLLQAGNGTLVVSSNVTGFTGSTRIQSGTLQLGNGGTTGGLSGNITNNATLAINRSDDFTFSTNSTGTGKLLKLGTNTVTVNRTQSNTGGTVIDSGTLALASNNILATTGNLVVNELGTFNLGTNNQTLSTVTLNGGNITGTGKITSNSSFAIQGGSVSALLAGSAGLVKSGTSSFAITGNNLYSGKTVVADGTISFNTTNATRTAAQALGTNADFDLGAELSTSGTLNYTGAAATFAKNIKALGAGNNTIQNSGSGLLTLTGTLTKNGTILVLAGGAGGIQVNGVIAGSAENSDLVLNGGNITLNATNTYNGPTYLNNGTTLTLSVANALPGDLIIDASSSVAFGANQTIEALSGVAGSTIDIGSYTLTMGSNGTDSLYEGGIEGSGKVVKTGTNAITLSGANTYNGTTTINGGVLVFGVPSSLYNGDNSTWTGSKIVVNSGGAIALAVGANGSFTGNQVTEIFDSLSSNSTPGGILAGGSLGLDVTGEMEMQQVASNRQGGGAIGFVKLGDGTLTITGNNTYTGPTAIRGGTLALASSDLLVATGNLTVQGGSLALGSNNQTLRNVTLTSGTISGSGAILTASNFAVQSGVVSANLAGNATFQKTTSGTVMLSGLNSYTGSTTLSAGTLNFLTASALYSANSARWTSGNITASSGSTMAFGVGGTYAFSSSNIDTLITNLTQSQSTSGGIVAGASIGLDTSGGDALLSTIFKDRTGTGAGAIGLVKLGQGTLTLTGNSSNTGGIFIESGTLAGNSNSLKGNITNNATLNLGSYGSYMAQISGMGSLITSDTLTFLGNATMTGGTTIQSGILTIGGVIDPTNPYSPLSYRAGSLTGDIANEGGLVFDLSYLAGTRTYNGTITGNGSLRTTFTPYHYPLGANGTLRLTGNNTFTGGTSVSIGTLDISGGTLASTGSVTVSEIGTLAIGSSNQTIGLFLLNSQSAQATGAGTLTTTAENYDLRAGTVYLSLNGTAGLTKNSIRSGSNSYDNGLVYLSGNNTSTGNITISSGILSFDNVRSLYSGNNASWTKEKISVSANATLSLATGAGGATDGFNNAQITEIFSNLTENGTGGLTANSKIGLNTTGNFTLTTTITDRPDGGVLGLDKIGGSTLVLDSNNTFTGELSIFEGTVTLGRNNALRTSSDLVVDSKSSAAYGFNVGNYSQQFVDITLKEGLLAGGSGAFVATGNYTMIKGNATANLSGNASLIKTNTSGLSYNVYEPEIVFLSGNNSYTGRTTVDGLEWYGNQSPSPSSNPGAPTIQNAKLQFQTEGSLYGGNATLWTPENISVDSYGILSLRTGSAGFNGTQVSTIIQNLITANRSTGGFLDKSVLGIDTNGENLVINDAIGDTTGLTSGGGAVGLAKYGSGTLTLNGNSTRSFSTSVTGGNLVLGANATLSSASANLLVDNALLNIASTNQTVRKVTVTSGSIIGSGTLTSSADGFVFGTANITANLAGAVGATIDQGSTILSGNNTYTGNTTMGYSATLSLANVNALSGSTLVIQSNYSGPLQFSVNGTNTYNLGGLSGTANIATGSNSLAIGANSQNSTYSGNLSGTGSITKTGNGTLTLTGNSTYTGGTTISGGTLSISNNGSITHALVDTNIGNGTLNLSSGSISNAKGNIGVNAGSTGVATVSGGNWTNTGNFTVGNSGDGTLNLSGGLISNTGNYSYIGLNAGSTGVANVSGGNWTNGNELRVGDNGNGTLNITDGTVSNVAGFLGYGNGTGVVNVSGGNWTNSDRLRLGRYGNGTLNLTGGNVIIGAGGAGTLTVAVNSSSTGTLNIGNGTTVGNLQAARVTPGSGKAIVNFNHSGNHSFSPIMEGNLTVNKLGTGTTTLTGNNTYSGGTVVSSGTLQGNTQSLHGAITNNASLVFNQTTNGTYTGVMSGSGDLSKIGNGTLTLSGNSSSFNGTAAINTGTVSLTGSMANASTTINNGGTLTGNGSLGAVTINSGGILTGNGTAGAVTINSGGAINPGNSPGRLTVGNSIWNGGGIYNWELASANGTAGTGWDLISSTGNLTINAAAGNQFIINASTSNASGFNPNVKNASWKIAEFAGGISGFDPMAFTINATGFANLPSMYAFGITQNGTALNFSYATVATWIGGTGNWTNTANWETGFAAINGVAVDYAGTNGTSTNNSDVTSIGGLTFTNNASGSFTLAGGALSIGTGGVTNNSNSTQTVAINLTLAANQTLAANTANLVLSGNISGNASLTKAGNKTLTLIGNNTYTGDTIVKNGTLALPVGGSISSAGNMTIGSASGDNGTLSISGGNVSNAVGYLGNDAGSVGTATVSAGSWTNNGSLVIGNSGTGSLTISGGNLSNTVGYVALGFNSNGTVNVSGGTWANSGDLTIGYDGTGSLTINGTGTVTNAIGNIGFGGGGNGTVNISGGTWANSSYLFIGALNGSRGSLTINSGNVTNTDGYVGNQASSNGTVNVSGGTWTNSANLFVGNQGTGRLTINGTGNVTNSDGYIGHISGSNGAVTVSGGTWTNNTNLFIGNEGTGSLTISGTGNVTNSNGYVGNLPGGNGTVSVSGGTWTNSSNLAVGVSGTGSLTINGTGTVIVGDTLSRGSNGTINLASGGTLQIGTGGATGTLATDLTNDGTLLFDRSSESTYSSVISGTGAVIKNGNGTLVFTNNNTYTGGTSINQGSLYISTDETIIPVYNIGNMTVASGATLATDRENLVGNLALNGGTWVETNGWGGSLAGSVALGATSTFQTDYYQTVTANITGSGGLVKTGSGSLILSGNNSYTGATAIDSGTLLVNGSQPSSATTVNSGGTLGGNGTLGAVTITSGGAIAPGTGDSLSILTVGNSVWNGNGTYNWQLGNAAGEAGAGWDLISSAGSLTINATSGEKFVINATALEGSGFNALAANYKWQIASFSGNITGFSTNKFDINASGFNGTAGIGAFSVSANSTALSLNYRTLFVWDAGNGTWSTDTNWLDNSLPVNGAPIEFAGLGGTSTNNNYLTSISGLTFTANAGEAYTLAGGNLSIGAGGIVNDSSYTQTLGLNIALGANQTFAANTANLNISGNISGGYSLTKEGRETLTLSGNNTHTGGTTISTGTLVVEGSVGGVANNATFTIQQGGIAGSVNNLVGATATNNGTVASLANAGTFTNSGNITGNATTSGTLASTGLIGGTLGVDSGLATVGVGGQVVGTSTVNAGTLDVSGTVAGVSNNATFTIQQGGVAGSVNNLVGATATNNGTAASLANAGTFTNSGNITGNATTSGTLTSNGRVGGTLGVNGGSATIGNGGQVVGTSTVNAGALTVSGTVGGVSNSATFTVQQGGIAGDVTNLGTATNNGTTASLANLGTFTNSGNITGDLLSFNGSVTVGQSGRVSGNTTIVDGEFVVAGSVAAVTNNALLRVEQSGVAGNVINLGNGTATNNGTVSSLLNSGSFSNSGNINGEVISFGILDNTGNIGGALTVGGGETTISGTVAGPTAISAGVLKGNGTLGAVSLNSGGTIAPGTGNGTTTIRVGNSVWNGGGIYNWQTSSLNGTAGTNWDLISSAGALTLNATANQTITLNLFTLGNASLTGVKKASWEVGSFAQGITGFAKNAFTFDEDAMSGDDGRFFMSLGANSTTLVLNYKTAATWNTGTGNWTTESQWENNFLPTNGDEVEFIGAGGMSTNNFLSGNLSYISGIRFLEVAGAYTVNGNTLQIREDGIINASNQTQTIVMDLTANGTLSVNAASGNLVLSGIFSGASSLTKNGSQTLTLTGNNTYTGGTLVSAGTLSGTTTGLQGAIENNAVVNFDQNFKGTYAGVMSGTGSLTKSGGGVVLLSGNNSYSGGTTINSGVLAAAVETFVSGNKIVSLNPNAFGHGNVNINAGGAMLVPSTTPEGAHLSIGGDLTLNNGTIAFYDIGTSPAGQDLRIDVAGNFTNAGSGVVFDFSQVEALGAGNYTLVSYNGTNFATNAISSRAGVGTTLQGSFSVNGSSLVYTVLGAQSSGTDIQNNGGPNTPIVSNYTINQTGVVTIGENNMVAALTFNSGGSLNIQSNGVLNVTSGTLNVQNGSSVVGGGTLVAPAGLNKDGTGELDFTNNVVVTGTAAVNAGLLSVNGQLSANSVVVNPTATLGGAGVIVAPNVVVNGNLSPGNSPGTLNVVGNLVLTGANSTIIEIASPTNFDRIVVTGTATLGGTLNAVAYEGGTITPGARYDFLQAGSITGEFDSLIAPDGLRVRFLNSGTVGTLLFGPDTYVPMALNPNEQSVASALDTFITATDGDRLAVSIALDSLTTEQFPAAFDQIMPGFYESLANIAIEQAFAQTQMLNQRISSVRLGAAGFQAIGGISQPLVHDKNGKSAAEAKDASPIVESATATNWNSWALGTGMFSRTTNLGSVDNYNNNAGGFLVGTDYRWSENFVTGLYGGYDYSYAEYNGGGSTKGNSFNFGTYASYEKDGYYADAVIGGGYTGFQTKRSIEFSTIDRTASADPNSGQFTAGLNLGKDFEVGKFTLGPIVGAQYTYAGIGSFTESGAESLDLSLGQQNANSLRSTLGGRIAYTWNLNQKIALIPEVRMFWQHEFLNNPRTINASLDGGNGAAFDFETSDPYRDSVFAGAGVTAQFGKNLSGSVFYNINFGSQTYQSNMVSAGLNFSF